jgi:hypothetical protein
MPDTTRRDKVLAAICGLVLGVVIAFNAWAAYLQADPLDRPISLFPARRVEERIKLRAASPYRLQLVFERGNRTREEMDRLIGGGFTRDGRAPTGTIVPIAWSLRWTMSGQELASGRVESSGSTGLSEAAIYRGVATIFVPPGEYLLVAEPLRDVHELDRVPVRITLSLPPKQGTGELELAFWGGLLSMYLILPLTFALGAWLLWRRVRRPS